MGAHRIVRIGEEFVVKPNVTVRVTKVINAKAIEVTDAQGNSRVLPAHNLFRGEVTWLKKDGTLKTGKVRTVEMIEAGYQNLNKKFVEGSRHTSNTNGDYTILHINGDRTHASILWHSNGYIQEGVGLSTLSYGSVRNESLFKKSRPTPSGYYVYMASVRGEVVYIGRGKGSRWLHAINGCSSNVELNRLFFTKEPVILEVVDQDMEYEAAKRLERELIRKHKPKCNQVILLN